MGETRWEQARADERAAGQGGYGAHFARLMDEGVDIEGEARLADALAPRGGWILDAGSGMGRVGASLLSRGHHVVGVDFDPEVIEQSRTTFPDLPVVPSRLDELTPEMLTGAGFPTSYDVVVCVGNVMILLAPDTERTVLATMASLLAPDGRLLVGFALSGAPAADLADLPGHRVRRRLHGRWARGRVAVLVVRPAPVHRREHVRRARAPSRDRSAARLIDHQRDDPGVEQPGRAAVRRDAADQGVATGEPLVEASTLATRHG